MSEWISSKDRLPSCDMYCFVYDGEDIRVAEFHNESFKCRKDGSIRSIEVTYWMSIELPEEAPMPELKQCPVCGGDNIEYGNDDQAMFIACGGSSCAFQLTSAVANLYLMAEMWNEIRRFHDR